MDNRSPLDIALEYACSGLYVFPVHAGTNGGRKAPVVKSWPTVATVDPDQISAWWREWPACAIGLAHRITGTVAVDIDRHGDVDGWLTWLGHRVRGEPEPVTLAFMTASGGGQRVYARPHDLAELSGNYAGALGPGLDLIFGYSVLPSGSATPGRYWVDGNGPSDIIPSGVPDWMVAHARAAVLTHDVCTMLSPRAAPVRRPADDGPSMRYVATALEAEVDAVRMLQQGQRQTGLARAAANVGRAVGRAGRPDLLAWCEDTLIGAADWTGRAHEVSTIRRQLAWGVENG